MVAVATSGSGKAGNLTIDAGYINLVGAIDDKGTLVGGIESSSRSTASTAIGGDLTVPGHGQRRLFAQSGILATAVRRPTTRPTSRREMSCPNDETP